jgi:hypothetical protein
VTTQTQPSLMTRFANFPTPNATIAQPPPSATDSIPEKNHEDDELLILGGEKHESSYLKVLLIAPRRKSANAVQQIEICIISLDEMR